MFSFHPREYYISSCKKVKYLFPKAHAVAYVMMAFRIAWFKIYHPLAFYAAAFTVRTDDFDADIICKGLPEIENQLKNIKTMGNDATDKDKKFQIILEMCLEMYQRKAIITYATACAFGNRYFTFLQDEIYHSGTLFSRIYSSSSGFSRQKISDYFGNVFRDVSERILL